MRIVLVSLLLILLAACGPSEATPTPAPTTPPPTTAPPAAGSADLTGTWVLGTLAGQPALGGLTLILDPSGQASGNGGCNNFSSTATLTDSTIAFAPIISTKMACADNAMNTQETAYLTALQSAQTYQTDGASLTLFDAQGAAVAVFARQ
ncbi:MAG TPA: META domain-containing protein [Herpetosiphonaceae bacterium]|nr:META domain-containing protein [Herpetosiphonaceae bacterium]